jgi:hypothetical protein
MYSAVFLPGPDAWDEPAVLAHVVGGFVGIENNRNVEESRRK